MPKNIDPFSKQHIASCTSTLLRNIYACYLDKLTPKMAEGTYEYECQRAELLGVEKPDYDEWLKAQKEAEAAKVAEEEVEVENIKAS